MISTPLLELVIDTVVPLTHAKWETVSGQFGGYLKTLLGTGRAVSIELRGLGLESLEKSMFAESGADILNRSR
jgi:hypothetical protein